MEKWKEIRKGEPSVAWNTAKLILVVIATFIGILLTGRIALLVLPFLIGLAMALMLDKPMRFLNRRLHISRTIGSGISVALIVILTCTLLGILLFTLYMEIRGFIIQLPQFYNDFVAYVEQLFDYIETEYSEWITTDMISELETLFDRLRVSMLSLVNRITRGVWNTAISVPQVLIGFMMTFFSMFFFLRDREKIGAWLNNQIPQSWNANITRARNDLFSSLFGYIRAIIILAFITFIELIIGFSILKVRYGILIAFICAILDMLPAIGTGWVITPWAIVSIILGNYRMGIGLLILYFITWFVRQILESRIVGGQIGMHPLVLLLAMYIGMQFLGVIGLLAGPLTIITMRSILRLYMNGRTFREVVYAGIEEPVLHSKVEPSAPVKKEEKKRKSWSTRKNI